MRRFYRTIRSTTAALLIGLLTGCIGKVEPVGPKSGMAMAEYGTWNREAALAVQKYAAS